jgi:hypothetical protein
MELYDKMIFLVKTFPNDNICYQLLKTIERGNTLSSNQINFIEVHYQDEINRLKRRAGRALECLPIHSGYSLT